MKQKIKRVKRVAHLYVREYETAAGDDRKKYYGIFTCKAKGQRRVFPLGGDLGTAKEALALLLADNVKGDGKDFDAERANEKRGYTFSEWAEEYFAKKVDPEKHAGGVEREKRSYETLKPFFGNMLLSEIKRSTIMEYRTKRLQEVIMRGGKPVKFDGQVRTVSFVTVNRELAFLRFMLNMAEDDEIIEAAPRFKSKGKNGLIKSEKGRQRTRTVTPGEYQAILSHMKRPQQRYVIALYESSMRRDEPIAMTWDMVDLKKGLITLPATIVKEKSPRRTPISWELRHVLEELKEEQKKIPNVGKKVFTRNGRPIKSIRTAFERALALALEKQEIEDGNIVPHDFRRTAITRWTRSGIPREIVMDCSGHKRSSAHDNYLNFTDDELIEAFHELRLLPSQRTKVSTPVIQAKSVENASAASY
ncbi:MAG TPA: site-specific integrase [Candidatus Binatia bacterium]|jgi:integrase